MKSNSIIDICGSSQPSATIIADSLRNAKSNFFFRFTHPQESLLFWVDVGNRQIPTFVNLSPKLQSTLACKKKLLQRRNKGRKKLQA